MSAPLCFENDDRGAWVWLVWAISETAASIVAVCSDEAATERHVVEVPHLYPDAFMAHVERVPVNHGLGANDLKAMHRRAATSARRHQWRKVNPHLVTARTPAAQPDAAPRASLADNGEA